MMSDYPCNVCLVKVQCIDRQEFCSQLNESLEFVKNNLLNLKICPDCKSIKIEKRNTHYLCTSCNHQFFINITHSCRSIFDRIIFQMLN